MIVCHVGLGSFGPFKKALRGLTYLLVMVDKFIKWIEVRPLAKIDSKQIVSFVQDIIFCFGVPNSIITGNGTQFTEVSSWISMMSTTSGWTRPWSPTREQMGRSSALVA
jgi:hypothetical protein